MVEFMEIEKDRFAIVGLARSGMAALEYLQKKGKEILIYDRNPSWEPMEEERIKRMGHFYPGQNPTGEEDVDVVIVSPGIPASKDFVQRFVQRGVCVVGELEFAYRCSGGQFIGITGTNGKTTVTTWVHQLLQAAGMDSRIGGNIGLPVLSQIENASENTWFVTEVSSFQLETVWDFRCHIACLLNLSEDHLDRHGTMECYRRMKEQIFANQSVDDFALLNIDEGYDAKKEIPGMGRKIFISLKEEVNPGVFLKDERIFSSLHGEIKELCAREEIFLKGRHNLENALFTAAIGLCAGVDSSLIRRVLKEFRGVEHRLQYVHTIDGVAYYNDSKGTNPNAAIQALTAFEQGVFLIAGGYDKQLDFRPWIRAFGDKVKGLILLGACADRIQKCAKEEGFQNILRVNTMAQAVKVAHEQAEAGDTVLLSPACASWDMYPSFEERGKDFVEQVFQLTKGKNSQGQ